MVSPGNDARLDGLMEKEGIGPLPLPGSGGQGTDEGEWLLNSTPSSALEGACIHLLENIKGDEVDDSGSVSSPLLSESTMMSESKLGGGVCDNAGTDMSVGGLN